MKFMQYIFIFFATGLFSPQMTHAQEAGLLPGALIPFALESATNVSRFETAVLVALRKQANSFPKTSSIDELNASYVLALNTYGSEYCSIMIDRDIKLPQGSRWAHDALDFKLLPKAWSADSEKLLLATYAEIFWQREITSNESEFLLLAIKNLKSSIPNTFSGAKGVLMALCSSYINSPAFMYTGGF